MKESNNAIWFWLILIGIGSIYFFSSGTKEPEIKTFNYNPNASTNSNSDSEEDGYTWAEKNDIDSFQDCQDEFGTGYEEDECNRYVKDNHTGYKTFNDYECTEDCSGHQAGYDWADNQGIDDEDDCGGNSESFIEGCKSYVEENQ
jgi:hypothetical protein